MELSFAIFVGIILTTIPLVRIDVDLDFWDTVLLFFFGPLLEILLVFQYESTRLKTASVAVTLIGSAVKDFPSFEVKARGSAKALIVKIAPDKVQRINVLCFTVVFRI